VSDNHDSSSPASERDLAPASDAPHSEHSREKKVEYLTAHQLAEVLQVSEATVHRLRRSGRIPAVLLTDRLIRFNLKDVQKALRPTHAHPHEEDDEDREPSPQLSFEDLFSEFTGSQE
jgi:excisionase family DNA binding protein